MCRGSGIGKWADGIATPNKPYLVTLVPNELMIGFTRPSRVFFGTLSLRPLGAWGRWFAS